MSIRSWLIRTGLALAGAWVLGATACDADGSAPAVPHAVTSTDAASCRTCHATGSGGAPKSPHPDRSTCVNCHAVK